MRKLFHIAGTIALIVFVAIGVAFGVMLYQGRGLDRESKEFVDRAIPAIVAHWDEAELTERASRELLRSTKPAALDALFERLRQLGPLVAYEGSKGEANLSYWLGRGSTISADYVAEARFQNGVAAFRITIFKRDGRWLIYQFRADPVPGKRAREGA